MAYAEFIVKITVVSGIGSTPFNAVGKMEDIRWKTPNDNSSFGTDMFIWTIFDLDQFPVDAGSARTGERSFVGNHPLNGQHTLAINTAGADGVYAGKIIVSNTNRGG